MSRSDEVKYAVDFRRIGKTSVRQRPDQGEAAGSSITRIARLMALAIRFEGLLRDGTIRDYAELARRGHVTRARMTQIMKLLDLAPDIQEQILFLPPIKGLNERNLRPIVSAHRLGRAAAYVSKDRKPLPLRPAFGRLEKLDHTCTRFRDLRLGLHEDHLDRVPASVRSSSELGRRISVPSGDLS